MFASAAVRKEVPVEEQLGLMPFKVSDLGDFKNVRTLTPGAAILLADGEETTGFEVAPFMVHRPDGIRAGTAGGSRPLRRAGRDSDSGRAQRRG